MDPEYFRSTLYLHWIQQAATHISKFSFTRESRNEILSELHPTPKPDVAQKLIEALEGTVSHYRGRNAFERKRSKASGNAALRRSTLCCTR